MTGWRWENGAQESFWFRSRAHQQQMHDAALEHAGDLDGKSVLDVGCGYGDLLRHLPPSCSYLGIDRNPHVIETARELWPGHRFAVRTYPSPADVVIAIATIQACRWKRRSFLGWVNAARERLVVVSPIWQHLPEADQGETWWEGVDREVHLMGEGYDWYVSVVRP